MNNDEFYNLIPCYRKLDNKPRMYDLVNNVFYTNDAIGEFEYETLDGIYVAPTVNINLQFFGVKI